MKQGRLTAVLLAVVLSVGLFGEGRAMPNTSIQGGGLYVDKKETSNRLYWAAHVLNRVESSTGLSSLLYNSSAVIDFSADFFCLNEARADFNGNMDEENLDKYRLEAIIDLSFLSGVSDSELSGSMKLLDAGDYRLSSYGLGLIDAKGSWVWNSEGLPNVDWTDFEPPDWAERENIEVWGSPSLTGDDWVQLANIPASDVWAVNSDRTLLTDWEIDRSDIIRLKVIYDSRLTAALRVGYRIELLPDGKNVSKALENVKSSGLESLSLISWFNYVAYLYFDPVDMDSCEADLRFPFDGILDEEETYLLARKYDRENPCPGYPDIMSPWDPTAKDYSLRNFSRAKLKQSKDVVGLAVTQTLYDSSGRVVGNPNSQLSGISYSQQKDSVNVSEIVYSISAIITNGASLQEDLRVRMERDENILSPYKSVKQRYYVLLPEGFILNKEPSDNYSSPDSSEFLSPYPAFYNIDSSKHVNHGWGNTFVSGVNVPGLEIENEKGYLYDIYWGTIGGSEADGNATLIDTQSVGNRQLVIFERTINQKNYDAWIRLWDKYNYFWGRGLSFSVMPVEGSETLPAGSYETQFLCQFLDDKDNPIRINCEGSISSTAAEAFNNAFIGNLIDPKVNRGDGKTLLSISSSFTNKPDFDGSVARIRVKNDSLGIYHSEAVVKPGDTYSYELTYSAGGESSGNVVLWCNVERYDRNSVNSQWNGSVSGVSLTDNGVAVYVRTDGTFDVKEYTEKADVDWLSKPGWQKIDPDTYEDWDSVKSLAFLFGGEFSEQSGKSTTMYIEMRAPEEAGVSKVPGQTIYTAYNEFIYSDERKASGRLERLPGCVVVKPVQIQLEIQNSTVSIALNTDKGIGAYTLIGLVLIAMSVIVFAAWHRKRKVIDPDV